MGKLDKTREKIKVEELSTSDRKELFQKFVKAGGQVVQEKPKKSIKIDRQKQKELAHRLDEHRKNAKNTPQSQGSASSTASYIRSEAVPYGSGLDILIARFRLFFMGVTHAGGEYYKKKYLEQFKVEFNPALMELQMIYLDIFKQNPSNGHIIIEQLDKIRPLYYELIEMTGDIWEKNVTGQILDNYSVLPKERYRVYDYRDPILIYFRKLYLLHKYVDTIYFAFDNAIDIQARLERGKSSVYAAKRKKIKNSLFIIFNKLFPRLYWTFCMMRGEIMSLEDTRRFDEIFDIKPFMKPGIRVANQPPSHLSSMTDALGNVSKEIIQEEEPAIPEQEPEPEPEEAVIPDDVRRGLDLMNEIDFETLKKNYIKDDLLRSVSETDKILKAYMLFLEFDKEYSFVLTTYKIKYNPTRDSRGRVDYRTRLTDIYNQMHPAFDVMREYFTALAIYEQGRLDRPSSNDQYYKYTKRLAELEQDKKTKSRNARNILTAYIGTIADLMNSLIQDMNVRHEIVQNPQDFIEFDNTLESDRKLNGKKVFEAILNSYLFAAAFFYRLSPAGDLYSDKTDDQPSTFGSVQLQASQKQTPIKTIPSSAPQESSSSRPDEKSAATPSSVKTQPKSTIQKTQSFTETEKDRTVKPESEAGSILGELDNIEKFDDVL
ncbi:MAG: hypothetical protein ACRCUT_14255 [Spirochaetota bacterium]